MNSDIDIFTYTDYRKYLFDYYNEQKKINPLFSLRVFAQLAGFASHNTLKHVMHGKRHIGSKSFDQFAIALNLTPRQKEYFECMVYFAKSKKENEKKMYYEKMHHIITYRGIKRIDELQFGFYSEWYHPVIRELITVANFTEDYNLLAKMLWPTIRPLQIKKSIELLTKLGLVKRNENGKLEQTDAIIATDKEVSMLLHRAFSRKMADLAKEALEAVPPAEREISSMTLGLSDENFIHIKKRIQEFKDEILQYISEHGNQTESVYQLNFQFFPFLRNKGKRRKHE